MHVKFLAISTTGLGLWYSFVIVRKQVQSECQNNCLNVRNCAKDQITMVEDAFEDKQFCRATSFQTCAPCTV